MLEHFRSQYITWDKANKNFHETIELSASDERGRRIVVQMIDNGQVVDLTGHSLNLYWETPDKHYMGLDNFDALDIRKGKFELYATTELLSNIGRLNGLLYTVDMEGNATTSLKLDINVNKGINVDAVESQNSFSALTNGLSRLLEIETNEQARQDAEAQREQDYETAEVDRYSLYETAEQERDADYEDRAGQLETTYAPRLTGAENNISDLINIVGEGGIVDSGINNNGHYWKFESGLAVCVHSYTEDNATVPTADTFSHEYKWTYPVPFVDSKNVFAQSNSGYYRKDEVLYYANINAINTYYSILGGTSELQLEYRVKYTMLGTSSQPNAIGHRLFAVGRWK